MAPELALNTCVSQVSMATKPNAPRRSPPKLTLQTGSPIRRSPPRPPRGFVNSRDPTSFNTLSNVYLTAIERSQAASDTPLTAINTLQSFSITSPDEPNMYSKDLSQRVVTPYVASYPETPLSATCASPRQMELSFPSVMTATPPLSAGPVEGGPGQTFSFDKGQIQAVVEPASGATHARRRMVSFSPPPPYQQPASLQSILRNSPLPPRTAILPPSPRRQSLRLAERAARRVGYNSPLTQDIVTKAYIRSHVELLCEDGSPLSPATPWALLERAGDNEVRDGGQTPGPLDDVKRRMGSGSATDVSSPISPGGIRKKKRVKRRAFQWPTSRAEVIDDDEESAMYTTSKERNEATVRPSMAIAPMPMIVCDEVPTPTIETSSVSASESFDVQMSDTGFDSSRATSVDSLMAEVQVPRPGKGGGKGDTPIPELAERATPVADCVS